MNCRFPCLDCCLFCSPIIKKCQPKPASFRAPQPTKFTIKRCNFKPFFFYFEQFFIYLIFRQVQYNYAVSSISDKERVPIDPNYKLMSLMLN